MQFGTSSAGAGSRDANTTGPISDFTLVNRLRYWFSLDNLIKDRYLVDLIDFDMLVSVGEIMKFPTIRNNDISKERLLEVSRRVSQIHYVPHKDAFEVMYRRHFFFPLVARSVVTFRNLPKELRAQELTGLFRRARPPLRPVHIHVAPEARAAQFMFMEGIGTLYKHCSALTGRDRKLSFRLHIRTEGEMYQFLYTVRARKPEDCSLRAPRPRPQKQLPQQPQPQPQRRPRAKKAALAPARALPVLPTTRSAALTLESGYAGPVNMYDRDDFLAATPGCGPCTFLCDSATCPVVRARQEPRALLSLRRAGKAARGSVWTAQPRAAATGEK
eukprot:gnl/Chilomastix_cuspidata/941.p1 GENE.gnl/Chilomastix_cuspidata/941~~gnl/Chilomastix_cuspidata/941.p1  ORF type:complete len:330 (+),score=72.99 gnl/Chilomastix_cuspidata/941:30-1019(+)